MNIFSIFWGAQKNTYTILCNTALVVHINSPIDQYQKKKDA